MTEFHNRVERLTQLRQAKTQQETSENQPVEVQKPKPWQRKPKPWELPPDPAQLAELQATAERMRRQRLGRNYEGNS